MQVVFAVLAVLAFIFAILFIVWARPGRESLRVHMNIVPVSISGLLALGFGLILWGVFVESRATIELGELSLSAEALRRVSSELGIGIITGVVAGAVIAMTQRWYDFEKDLDFPAFIREKIAQETGFEIIDLPDGGITARKIEPEGHEESES